VSLDKWAPTKKLPRELVRVNKKASAEIARIRALVLLTKIAEPKPSKGLVRVRTITKSSGKAILERRPAALAVKYFHNGF